MRRSVRIALAALLAAILSVGPTWAQADDVPEVVKTLLEEGDRHRQAGRSEQAIRSYEEAQRMAPSVVDTYAALGALYSSQNDLEKALEAFVTGLDHDPKQPNLLFNAAVVSLRLEQAGAALGYVERALGISRRDANMLSLKSAVLRQLSRLEEALEAQQAAVKLDAGNPQLLYRLGNLHYDLEQSDEAIDAFRRAIKKDRGFLRAWYNLGAVLFDLDRYDEALEAYLVALKPAQDAFAAGQEVDPSNARAFLNLGAIYFRQQQWTSALDAYDKALQLDPRQATALYNQGFIYFELDRYDDAYEVYLQALELDASIPLAYLHLGQIEAARGNHGEAVRKLVAGLERLDGTNRIRALVTLGDSYRALERIDDSVAAYRAVVAEDAKNLDALVPLGRLLRDRGEVEEARRVLESARRIDPEDSGVALELAGLARAGGDLERERAFYQEILARSGTRPEMWPVRVNLARVLLEQGDRTAARQTFEPVVERLDELKSKGLGERESQVLATIHGLLLASEGDLESARRRLAPVAAFAPAREAVAVLDAFVGDVEGAAEVLGDLLAAKTGASLEASARANLGQTLWLASRFDEARGHLKSAVGALPRNAAIRLALGEIAFRDNDVPKALAELEAANRLCDAAPGGGAEAPGRQLRVRLGRAASPELCQRAQQSLAKALVRAALTDLRAARGSTEALRSARTRADRAIELPLGDVPRAVAYLVRGTAQLIAGADQGARADLVRSFDALPESLLALARNNLGVARYRLGEIETARREFEAVLGKSSEAGLNLGIVLDEHTGDHARALELYEAYLADGGRRGDVEAWAERLRKVYQ